MHEHGQLSEEQEPFKANPVYLEKSHLDQPSKVLKTKTAKELAE